MRWLLTAALLLGCPSLLWAQTLSGGDVAKASSSQTDVAPSAPAFSLVITAPEDITQLLTRHLELQRYRELGDLSDDELDRLLDMARADTQNLVATLGYFSPVIEISRQDLDRSQAGRRVNINVIAGEPVQINQVIVRFSGPIADDPAAASQRQLIQDSWSLPAGNRFTQTRWDAAKQQALRQLTTQRYPTGTMGSTLADVDPDTHRARLEITLDSGLPYQLGRLEISGLQRFDAELVHRLARLPAGGDYDQKKLVEAQQRLTGSGFFDSAFVSIDTRTDPQAARVWVTLREARLQKIILGAGFSTDGGPRLSAEHLHNLVPGLGWRASSKVSVDRETQSLGTSLISPPDDSGWRWNTSLTLLNQKSGSDNVNSQRLRGGASQDGERIDRSYFLQYDRADSATTDQIASSVAESVSANYSFTLHNFDAMPFPASGWAWGMEVGGGSTLGSTHEPYGRILTRWQSFWPLGHGDANTPDLRAGRLAFRAQLGAVLAQDGISLPATQLFLAGGDNSVRGYGLRQIGTDLIGENTSAGRYMLVGSLEWQRPITVNGLLTDWEGTLFMDAGAVADKPSDLQAKVGIGAGVRWKSPVGPLQIDLAYGVAVQQFRLHLSVGFTF